MIVRTVPNTGQLFPTVYASLKDLKDPKVLKNFRLPTKWNLRAEVVFVHLDRDYEKQELEVHQEKGILVRTIRIPFDDEPTRYELKTEDGRYFTITRAQVLDFSIVKKEGVK